MPMDSHYTGTDRKETLHILSAKKSDKNLPSGACNHKPCLLTLFKFIYFLFVLKFLHKLKENFNNF